MRISKVKINNFRSLKNVVIDFNSITSFVGPNGVGKSSVLRALDWFFAPIGKTPLLEDDDVTNGCANEPIRVEVQFSGLSDEDKTELGSYVPEGATTFVAWKTRSVDGRENLSANAKSYPAFNEIRNASSATEKRALYNTLRAANPEIGLSSVGSTAAVDANLRQFESENPDLLEDAPETLQTDFFGFNSASKMSGLFDYVLITADLRATEESSDAKTSIIGRILERTIDRTAADEEIANFIEVSRKTQQSIYEKHFKDPLEDVSRRLNEVVGSYSPGRMIKVSPSEVELKAAKTAFGVSIQDGDIETTIDRQGHGFQRTILISALQMLATEGAASEKGVIFLAIEEPELFQHPIQAQAFAKVLRDLAEDTGKNIQVAYATHSPYFIDGANFHEVRRLVRATGGERNVTVHSCTVADVEVRIGNPAKNEQTRRQLASVISSQLPSAIFANVALVVEGTTERAVLEGLADRESIGKLETSGVVVVPAQSKTGLALPHAILSCLGIPTYSIFDADSGLEARLNSKDLAVSKVRDSVNNNYKMNREALRYFNLPEVDMPSKVVGDTVAIFEDHLESLLVNEWAGWQDACDAHEASTGEVIAKNSSIYRTIARSMTSEAPTQLQEILDRVMKMATT
ncbi:ATP-dependent endonuclease [Glutamicibacter soli]|uniref:ATP-dependent endonuclease n=1 Tax=Glutamicibacter soli TaxID=453836 RepID=A0A365YK90_9MICC|nr:ATP-dependent endonuclease [Glutamicibacter soli]RBM02959.1 ATP-dependent endonuclease [Glutamicibacter soli]